MADVHQGEQGKWMPGAPADPGDRRTMDWSSIDGMGTATWYGVVGEPEGVVSTGGTEFAITDERMNRLVQWWQEIRASHGATDGYAEDPPAAAESTDEPGGLPDGREVLRRLVLETWDQSYPEAIVAVLCAMGMPAPQDAEVRVEGSRLKLIDLSDEGKPVAPAWAWALAHLPDARDVGGGGRGHRVLVWDAPLSPVQTPLLPPGYVAGGPGLELNDPDLHEQIAQRVADRIGGLPIGGMHETNTRGLFERFRADTERVGASWRSYLEQYGTPDATEPKGDTAPTGQRPEDVRVKLTGLGDAVRACRELSDAIKNTPQVPHGASPLGELEAWRKAGDPGARRFSVDSSATGSWVVTLGWRADTGMVWETEQHDSDALWTAIKGAIAAAAARGVSPS